MGKDFGRLDLHVVGANGPGPFIDRGRHAQLQAILLDHQHQIVDYRARAAGQPPIMQARNAEQIAKLEKAIAHDREQLQQHPAEIHGSWFENRIIPLDTTIPDHPGVALLVAAYNRENQRRGNAGLPVGVTPHLPTAPHPVARAGPERGQRRPRREPALRGHRRLRRLSRRGAEILADDRARARVRDAEEGQARSRPDLHRVPRHGIHAAGRHRRSARGDGATARRRVRGVPRSRAGSRRRPARRRRAAQSRGRSSERSPNRSASAATRPTRPTATSTTPTTGRRSSAPATAVYSRGECDPRSCGWPPRSLPPAGGRVTRAPRATTTTTSR